MKIQKKKKKIIVVKDIETNKANTNLNEELIQNAIRDLSFKLPYMKWEHNEKEVLTKLKQLVDALYKIKVGEEDEETQ